jgi:hypothetical protein
MNEHFYNGFIKRAQEYGLSAIEADSLIKAAGPLPTPARASRSFGTPSPELAADMRRQAASRSFGTPSPELAADMRRQAAPTPKPTPTPKRNINPYTEGDLNDRKASSGKPTQLQIETANMMRRNNG